MGMMINRRRTYGVSSQGVDENSYIQDGLVFQLDGINKGSNPNAWTDLKAGYEFPYSNDAVVENNGVINCYSESVQSAFNAPSTLYTVEGVADYSDVNFALILYGSKNGDVVLSNGGGTITTGCNKNQCRIYTKGLKWTPTTTSVHWDFFMQNGNLNNWTGNSGWSQGYTGKFIIGGRIAGAYKHTGKIYAVRIYNRKLTEQEMLHNQRIDNVRFNLGLNI